MQVLHCTLNPTAPRVHSWVQSCFLAAGSAKPVIHLPAFPTP